MMVDVRSAAGADGGDLGALIPHMRAFARGDVLAAYARPQASRAGRIWQEQMQA